MIRDKLLSMADSGYKEFAASLIPESEPILGVRLPGLRRLAKEIAKEVPAAYLENTKLEYFEEIMLAGMVIGYIKTDVKTLLKYITGFIPHINNWSVCDSFCSGLKFTKKHSDEVFRFINQYFDSEKEFEVRFAVVMLLNYFICDDYIEKTISCIDRVRHTGYYARTACAWALSVCYVKYPGLTINFIKKARLDDYTHNKTLQKICESRRVNKADKIEIRSMKRIKIN